MIGIREVAEKAQVGVGTVSRALNGSGYVSKETKEKILKIAQELNYQPNELARHLMNNKSGIIGVAVPDIENPFFAKFIKSTEIELYKIGYKAVVCNTIGISTRMEEMLSMLEHNVIDGMITATDAPAGFDISKIRKPIVSLDRNWGDEIPVISSDNIKGGHLVAEHLIKSNAKNVLMFRSPAFPSEQPFSVRDNIIINELHAHNVNIVSVQIEWNTVNYDYYMSVAEDYLQILESVDSIYAADLIAIACMAVLNKNGIRIPEDKKIIGYDGISLGKLMTPQLTTVSQDINLMAKKCVDTIQMIISGNKSVPHMQLCDVAFIRGGTL